MVIYIRTEFAEVVEWQTRRTQNPLRDDLVRVQVPPSAPRINRDIDTMRIGIAVYFFIF